MGIKRAMSVATGYGALNVPEGQIGALIGADGAYSSVFLGGATQQHPLPLTGGQRIDLGLLPDSATIGYNVLTGTGVVQSAAGLTVTLNASNPEVVIDLPVFGATHLWSAYAEITAVCAAPGSGAFVALRADSNSISAVYDMGIEYSTDWKGYLNRVGSAFRGTDIVAAAALNTLNFIGFSSETGTVTRLWEAWSGTAGEWVTLLNSLGRTVTTGETLGSTDWDLALHAKWVSGDDLVVTFASVAVQDAPLQISTVP